MPFQSTSKESSTNDEPPDLLYPEDPEPGKLTDTNAMAVDAVIEHPDVEGVVPGLENVHIYEHVRPLTNGLTEEDRLLDRIYSNLMKEIIPYINLANEEEAQRVFACLAEKGLLQVTYDLGEAKVHGRELDDDYWTKRIVDALLENERQKESRNQAEPR